MSQELYVTRFPVHVKTEFGGMSTKEQGGGGTIHLGARWLNLNLSSKTRHLSSHDHVTLEDHGNSVTVQ